ncbi:MAG: AAA family ATPase [Pseudomonadota bacterium]
MRTLGGYDLGVPLHRGRQTAIHRGRRVADGLPVVIKLLDAEFPDLQQVERLRREHRLLSLVESPHVVRALDLVEQGHALGLVLEDVGGVSLRDSEQAGQVDLAAFLSVAVQAARGLAALHDAGIIHRDISPANIVWNRAEDLVQVIDLDIAQRASVHARTRGNPELLEGTLAYISPEQTGRMNRAVDQRTDLYALGATLYELLCGQPPFVCYDTLELVHAHLARPPRPPHELDERVPVLLSDLLLRLLAKRAEDRYQTAAGLAADLARCEEATRRVGHLERFTLGTTDRSVRFEISQELFGRAAELGALQAAFDEVRELGAARVVLIAGGPGVGKSTIARELVRPVVEAGAWYVSGQASDAEGAVPYAAFVGALGELAHQLLASPDGVLEAWRVRVLAALGANAGVVTALAPELERVLGPQPALADLPPGPAQARFRITLTRFFRVLGTAESPLVVFLDDLQWADGGTLDLLDLLVADPGVTNLLVLGAHRIVTPPHPLASLTARLTARGGVVRELTIGSLGVIDIADLLATSLRRTREQTLPLAEVCAQKTDGNPFFLTQFLSSLHEDGALRCSPDGGWIWELDRVGRLDVTDNVVSLMTARMVRLPEGMRDILRVAACVGRAFDPVEVAAFVGGEPLASLRLVQEAEAEGLVAAVGGAFPLALPTEEVSGSLAPRRYRFVHDRVRQAAWQLSTEAQRQDLHLAVARAMRARLAEPPGGEALFEAVGQFAQAGPLLRDPEERLEVARLCLTAGRQAKRSLAMGTALEHLERGIGLLPGDPWSGHYELCCSLHQEAVLCAQLHGDGAQMERWGRALLEHARTPLDAVRTWASRVALSHIDQRPFRAVEQFVEGARLLGATFPARPTVARILLGLGKLHLTLATHPRLDPAGAPLMTDPKALALLDLIRAVCTPAFIASPNLIPLLAFTITDLTVRLGVAAVSGWGVGAYGFVLAGPLGFMERGLHYADVAEAFQARQGDEGRASGAFLQYAFFHHWRAPLAEGVPILDRTARAALDRGDLDGVFLCRQIVGLSASFCGLPIPAQRELLVETERLTRRFKQGWYHDSNAMRLYALWRLSGEGAAPLGFDGQPYEPAERLAQWAHDGDRTCTAMQHIHDAFVSFILGDRAESLAASRAAGVFIDALVGTFYVPVHELLLALGLLWAARHEEADRGRHLRQARKLARRIRGYVPRAPENFLAMERLLEAERLRTRGRPHEAVPLYEEAGRFAQEYGLSWVAALASELEAEALGEGGSERLAREVRWEAWYSWKRLGALAKAQRFAAEHRDLSRMVTARAASSSIAALTSRTTSESATARLDLEAVLETCQALSGQLVLADLLDRLMAAALQNSGARRGLLLVRRSGSWRVEVEHDYCGATAPCEASARYPREVVQYAARTGQVVVVEDSAAASPFASDPYLRGSSPHSLLCFPLEHRGRQVGVLYLENEEVTHAFSETRVKALGMLCRQIAISIENARLFAEQERQARAGERFVPRELLGLLGRPSVVDVVPGDHAEREMTVLSAQLLGLSAQCEGLDPARAVALVNELLATLEPVCVRYRGVVYRRADRGLTALFPTGADDAMEAAGGLLEAMEAAHAGGAARGVPPVQVAVGLDSGAVLLAAVGSAERMDGAAIAPAVDLAVQIAALAGALGADVLISARTRDRLRHVGRYQLRTVGWVQAEGEGVPAAVLEVLDGEPSASRELKRATRADLEAAIEACQRGERAAAAELFTRVLRRDPADGVAAAWLRRCQGGGPSERDPSQA